MPRNSQGVYTLPAGNPVVPGTLIETTWANPTMADIADTLTASLPRDGSAPMTGPLTLQAAAPTQPRHAVSKGYMEQFLAYATGMPIGAITPIAGPTIPAGYLLCDGQAVSRTTYADLFTAIGTIYGSGDGATTFNVPDLRDWFIRGRADARAIGSTQAAAFASHAHSFSDPGHTHTASQPAHDHTITTGGHNHSLSDPGHTHSPMNSRQAGDGGSFGAYASSGANIGSSLPSSGTGISIAAVGNLGGSADSRQPAVTVASAATGASIGATGGDETRPQNVAMNYVIKAVNDSASTVALTGITSSDDNAISIDNTLATVPMLDIHSNVAFGLAKLDGSGKLPLSLLPTGSQQLLGYFDASPGLNPSQAYPAVDFASGDTYIISVAGTILVRNPVTLAEAMTPVAAGSLLQYVENSLTNPTGWYYVVATSTVVASQVGLTPVGSISATNVQAGFAEVDGDLTTQAAAIAGLQTADANNVKQTSATGAMHVPAGTTLQQPASPQFGDTRANSDLTIQEWWNGSAWIQLGGMSQAAAEAAFLQVDGGNQMIAPLVFDTNAHSVVKVGAAAVAQFPTTCGIPFMKNKLINGEVTRINQRGFDGNWTPKGNYPPAGTIAQKEATYGYDQWAKASSTDMLQVIEAGNFRPSTVHTLSGQNVTTQQITSPASGNWTITVPQTARNVQLEEGAEATPFEIRPIAFELAQCQRYYEELHAAWVFYTLGGAGFGSPVNFVVQKYQAPALVWGGVTATNVTNATVGSTPQPTRGISNSATATATGIVVHSGTCKASAVL